jgi:hypothetical protein
MLKPSDQLSCLSKQDKAIFLEAVEDHKAGRGFRHAYTMSIFSSRGELKLNGDYTYRDLAGEKLFYINRAISRAGPLILDCEGRIVPESNIMLGYHHLLLQHIHGFLLLSGSIPLDQATIAFNEPSLAIQSWFITYGHFHDEVYALADFQQTREEEATVILDYPPSDSMHLDYKTSPNYERLQTLALGHSACNAFEAGSVPIRLAGLSLISHMIDVPTFHLFPEKIRDTLVDRTSGYQPHSSNVIFVSRQIAQHLPRNIANQDKLEDACRSSGILVCYPEQLSFDRLVRRLNAAQVVIITWGGALTNLVYLAKGASVLILKSKSYSHESLELFNKIIQQRGLKINVIESNNENTIEVDQFSERLAAILRN